MMEELDERLHGCPACGDVVERTKPTCRECWSEIPARLKLKVAAAYRWRRSDPAGYQEALAGLLQWCRDRRVREIAVSSWVVDPVVELY